MISAPHLQAICRWPRHHTCTQWEACQRYGLVLLRATFSGGTEKLLTPLPRRHEGLMASLPAVAKTILASATALATHPMNSKPIRGRHRCGKSQL